MEKVSILLAREIQRSFLTYYVNIGFHLKKSPVFHPKLGEENAHERQEVMIFTNNAKGILYYQTLAFYKGLYAILPLMAAMIIPLLLHPTEIPLFYIEILLEIFFIVHFLRSSFKAVHAERMKKKAKQILGSYIPTYEEIHRVRNDNYE